MSLLEQTASGVEGVGDSPFLFDPNLETEQQVTLDNEQQVSRFTNWIASLMETEAPGNLLACGNLDMRSPKTELEGEPSVTIAGGFNQSKTEWTWSVEIKNREEEIRLVSDVDLDKKVEADKQNAYQFNLGRDEQGITIVPGGGSLNLPNLWQQISVGHQGKITREHFVYDDRDLLATYLRKAFFRNVFLRIEPLLVARETAEKIAEEHKPSFTSAKIVPYNAVGFRGSTGIRTIGFASPTSYLDHTVRSERALTVDQLPVSIVKIINAADPLFDCPVATLDPESIYQTKVFDIKDLATPVII
jgi:hypothetical protein